MSRRTRVLAVSAAVLPILALTSSLAGAANSSHRVSLTLHSFTISSSTRSDAPGTRQSAVGLVTGRPIGQGVSALKDKVTSASSTALKFAGRFTIYTVHGELQGRVDFTIKPQSNGGATGSGHLSLSGGTGRYQGAAGKLRFAGRQSPQAPDFTSHLTGTITY
jgi:hypothetical protein